MRIARSPIVQKLRNISSDNPSGAVQPGDLPNDTVTINPIESATEALTHKPASLQRPVILVNGLARNAHDWDKMVPWLTSNPDNQFGAVYKKGQDEAFESAVKSRPEANVFVLDPSDNLASPRVLAGEVRRMIDHILRHGKADKVDLVGHSQGGLDILAALDQGEDRVERVVTLATPWKGAAVASVARRFDGMAGGSLGGVLAPVGRDEGALFDLRPIEKNDWLQGVHDRWQARSERPGVTAISGSGTPTPGGQEGVSISAGDGFVSIQSGLGLPGARTYHLAPGQWAPGDQNFRAFHTLDVNHLGIAGNSTAFKAVGQALTDTSAEATSNQTRTSTPKIPAEANLDQGEDLIHDHLRAHSKEPIQRWLPVLDEIQGVRQKIVDSQIDQRAGELKTDRARWIVGAGVAAGAVGCYLGGALGSLPGAVTALVGAHRMWDGMQEQKQAQLAQTDAAAIAANLKDYVEANL